MFSPAAWHRLLRRATSTPKTICRQIHSPNSSGKEALQIDSKKSSQCDAASIPLGPTWSVNTLLASYPTPTLEPSAFNRIYELSALVPPAKDAQEYGRTKKELEDLIRLVEAVKFVKTESGDGVPDGRIWNEGGGINLDRDWEASQQEEGVSGKELLDYARQTKNGMYLVDTERKST